MSKHWFALTLYFLLSVMLLTTSASAQEKKTVTDRVLRIGIIGTTTSHVPAALTLFNSEKPTFKTKDGAEICKKFRVTGVYVGGMPDNDSSWTRREKYSQEALKAGAKIYPTVEELVQNVDVVFLESVDGRPHLEQAKPVLAAKKPMFIDKPIAGSLADALEIVRLAKENNVMLLSSSSLRYVTGFQDMRNSRPLGKIYGCEAFSPASLNEKHPDMYWYGIHGVESLFTIMGPDCISVSRTKTADTDFAVGIWNDNRIGTFRGIRKGGSGYGAKVFCEKGIQEAGTYEGYEPMFVDVCKCVLAGKPSIDINETINIYAFMSAADESWKQGGKHIYLKDTIEKARNEKQYTVNLVLNKEGEATWNNEVIDLDAIPAKIEAKKSDGTVVRIIINNRAGASFEIVQKYLKAVDKAYVANYLY